MSQAEKHAAGTLAAIAIVILLAALDGLIGGGVPR